MIAQEGGHVIGLIHEDKWVQDDLQELGLIQSSLSPYILEAFAHCVTAKYLWENLNYVYRFLSKKQHEKDIKSKKIDQQIIEGKSLYPAFICDPKKQSAATSKYDSSFADGPDIRKD